MSARATCSFCGKPIYPGTGFMYVKNDGSILWFCSRKCYKNMVILKRKARKLKWTLAGRGKTL